MAKAKAARRRTDETDDGYVAMSDGDGAPAPELPNNAPYAESQASKAVPSDGILESAAAAAAAAAEEDERYRLRALDYSSGHIAASVKENDNKKGRPKKGENEPSSLFHAILRSARSSSAATEVGTTGGARAHAEIAAHCKEAHAAKI